MRLSKEYIAGFVDGEAYIGLTRKTRKDCRTGFYYRPTIKIVQLEKNNAVLFLIKEIYGGYVSKVKFNSERNMRPANMWEIANGIMVKKFIEDIQPFSLVKGDQIKTLLEFIDLPHRSTRHDKEADNIKYDKFKEDIYWRLRTINKRGLAETKR